MNIITKLFRDITRQYLWKTRKEKRYRATASVRRISKEGSSFRINLNLRDLPDNNEYYEILEYRLPCGIDYINGVDAPINKKKPHMDIEIISEYEVEIKEKVYY